MGTLDLRFIGNRHDRLPALSYAMTCTSLGAGVQEWPRGFTAVKPRGRRKLCWTTI